jgi:acetyl esterase/lipase
VAVIGQARRARGAAQPQGRAATPLARLQLVGGALFAGLGTLAVVPAPTSLLWKVGLGVNEWGYWVALLALTPLLPGWRRSWPGRIGAGLGVVGAALALSSLVRAAAFAGDVPAQITAAFGVARPLGVAGAPGRSGPLVALDLVRGISSPAVRQERVTYASPEGQPQAMDLYLPQAPELARAPGVITIHGGSWRNGTAADQAELNRYLAARGYVVAAIDYRLSPQWRFPAAVDDVRAAVAYLKAHAAELGLDPTRLALLGRSAGGQLALLAAYTPADSAIRGVVSLYGPADLVYGYNHPSNPAVLDSTAVLTDYLGGSPTTAPAAYEAASPINFVGPQTPPTLLIHGERDDLVSVVQSERLDAKLAAAGRPHLFLRFPWANHGCDFTLRGPCGQISTYAVERFLAAVMR